MRSRSIKPEAIASTLAAQYAGEMARTQLDLMPGEKMVLHSHPHWWFFWKQVAGGVVVLVLLVLWAAVGDGFFNDVMKIVFLIGLLVWLINVAYQYVQWRTTQFAVTSERVAFQSGVIRRSGVSIPLNRVNNVNFDQSIIARMLDNGVVTVESAGETGDSVFENIPNPEKVRSLIFAQVEADEQADSERDAAALAKILKDQNPQQSGSEHSPQERLKQLDDLHAQGLVTDEEFDSKRREILGEL